METLEGFPNLPAMVRAEQSSAAPHAALSRLAICRESPARCISGECLTEARRLLKENRNKLDAIAKELLIHETLDEPAVYAAAGIARRARIEEAKAPIADRPRLLRGWAQTGKKGIV